MQRSLPQAPRRCEEDASEELYSKSSSSSERETERDSGDGERERDREMYREKKQQYENVSVRKVDEDLEM